MDVEEVRVCEAEELPQGELREAMSAAMCAMLLSRWMREGRRMSGDVLGPKGG